MAKNITVRDIVKTAKDMRRYTNYAERNMPTTTFAQVEERLKDAREIMYDLEDQFMSTDISTLTYVDPALTRRIAMMESDLKSWYKYLERDLQDLQDIEERLENTNENDDKEFEDLHEELAAMVQEVKGDQERIAEKEANLEELKSQL